MAVRFYSNLVSQASRRFAAGLFAFGLAVIVFGFLVYVLREIFALLAAAVFIVAGAGCIVTAGKIYWAQRTLDHTTRHTEPYRENVQVRIEDHYDI